MGLLLLLLFALALLLLLSSPSSSVVIRPLSLCWLDPWSLWPQALRIDARFWIQMLVSGDGIGVGCQHCLFASSEGGVFKYYISMFSRVLDPYKPNKYGLRPPPPKMLL